METLSAYSLPRTFAQSVTCESRVFHSPQTTWGGAVVPLCVLDLQRDLTVWIETSPLAQPRFVDPEFPNRHRMDLPEHERRIARGALVLLREGIDDVRAGRTRDLRLDELALSDIDE